MITRFSVLPDTRGLMLGIDKHGLFEPGVIYEAFEMLDEIIIRKVGKYALPDGGPGYPNRYSDANSIIDSGLHLITQEELDNLNKEEDEKSV
jgi:hypothetical protein